MALRGYFILLVECVHTGKPGGKCVILDFVSRKQAHVCRAALSEELFALFDAIGAGLKICAYLEEVISGCHMAA